MPIYEYACAACGHEFEEWQKMSDAPVRTCPKCKKKKVERLISRTAFQLKGGGWYADLYSSSKPGESKGDSGEKAEKTEKAEKSDSGKDAGSSAKEAPASSSSDAGSGSGKEGAAKSPAKAGASDSSPKKKSAKKAESRAA